MRQHMPQQAVCHQAVISWNLQIAALKAQSGSEIWHPVLSTMSQQLSLCSDFGDFCLVWNVLTALEVQGRTIWHSSMSFSLILNLNHLRLQIWCTCFQSRCDPNAIHSPAFLKICILTNTAFKTFPDWGFNCWAVQEITESYSVCGMQPGIQAAH